MSSKQWAIGSFLAVGLVMAQSLNATENLINSTVARLPTAHCLLQSDLVATDSRLARQFDKLENFVDTGLASSSSTKTRRQSPRVIDDTPRIPYSYVVFAAFRNTGAKTVAAFEWDYVLTDKKDPQREVLRLSVRSEEKIPPGRKREVESRARRGLDHIWKIRKTADANAIITRIEYADGSVWEAGKLTETKEP